MSELGDLFELVVRGPERLPALEATAHGHLARGGHESHMWLAGVRRREEVRDEAGDLVWLGVDNGADWWKWDVQRNVARTNTLGDRGTNYGIAGALAFLRGQGRLIVSPQVELLGREEVAGRSTMRVRIPEREIWVDLEFGVALRAMYQGRVLLDVQDIVYDVAIGDERFEPDLLPREVEVRAASELYDEGSVAEIASLVEFPVFAPGKVTVEWPAFGASRHRGDGLKPETVYVQLRSRPIWISHSLTPHSALLAARRTNPEDWRPLVRDGVELEVCEQPAVVRLVRDAVHLEISGEVENLEQLIAIALSLQRVSTAGQAGPGGAPG
jgi:hypothetical protein